MQIKSRFKDYYDAGMGHTADKFLFYVRENQAWDAKNEQTPQYLSPLLAFSKEHKPRSIQLNSPGGGWGEVNVSFGLVLLAGLIYPLARLSRKTAGDPYEHHYLYDYEALNDLLSEHGFDMVKRRQGEARSYRYINRPAKHVEQFFALKGSDKLSDFAYKNKLVLACLAFGYLQVNPRLSNFEFFRAMEPFVAFQEISMFLGNLAAPDPLPVVLTEKERVAKHGFDKWSFRKMPRVN